MSNDKIEFDEAEQRKRDELLLKLLKTPPQPRQQRDNEKKGGPARKPNRPVGER